ncbi:MAG: protein kinase family protein [Tepidibacillus sp.]
MNMLFNRSHKETFRSGKVIKGKWNGRQYIVRRSLGSGENGTVYLVQSSGKLYALKISPISIDLGYEITVIQRLSETQGPSLGFSVFDIDDFIDDDEHYSFYVMPYVQGISIKYFFYGKSEKDYLKIFIKMLKLLEVIHKEGWAFGDLKPEHFLIDPDLGKLSMIDFGGVTKFGEGIRQYTEIYDRGSWGAGTRKADPHYDLFSIVMILLQLTLGEQKFYQIYRSHRSFHELYDIIPNIHALKNLSPILIKILNGTYTSAGLAIEECSKFLGGSKNTTTKKPWNWIEWLFTSSIIFFILMFGRLIYLW